MKLVKLTLCLVTLVSVAPVAKAATGVMDKEEHRAVSLICAQDKSNRKIASVSNKVQQDVTVKSNSSSVQ